MQSATPTRFWLSLLSCSLVLVLTSCGGVTGASKSDPNSLTPGNWSLTATSSDPSVGEFQIGGNLAPNAGTLSPTMYISNSLCFDVTQPVSFTGTVQDQQVTLTSATVSGQVLTVVATETSSTALNGTYTIAGGCGSEDHGTVAANLVPSISGTWKGTVSGSGGSNVGLSIALTQASTASANGTYALTGNITYTGSTCSVSGTVNDAFIAGSSVLINGNTNETDGSDGSFAYDDVLLDNSQNPKHMTGTYLVDFGLCAGDFQTLTVTRQ